MCEGETSDVCARGAGWETMETAERTTGTIRAQRNPFNRLAHTVVVVSVPVTRNPGQAANNLVSHIDNNTRMTAAGADEAAAHRDK